LDSLLRN